LSPTPVQVYSCLQSPVFCTINSRLVRQAITLPPSRFTSIFQPFPSATFPRFFLINAHNSTTIFSTLAPERYPKSPFFLLWTTLTSA
jgi:hypothetical protein